jgi:putative inorganic carbon (hco3(-)) transporter
VFSVSVRLTRVARGVALVTVGLVPLAVWPGVGEPFVVPRLVLVGVAAAVIAGLLGVARVPAPRVPVALGWAVTAWVAAVAVSAAFAPTVTTRGLLVPLVGVAWGAGLAWAAPSSLWVVRAAAGAAAVVALVALAQAAGVDPFALAGWAPADAYGPRMRVYATLGNPNFAGAYFAAKLPLALVVVRAAPGVVRPLAWAGVAVIGSALGATGSRGAWLGAAVGLGVMAVLRARRDHVLALASVAVVVGAGVFVLLAPARPAFETVRGRLYIWSVAAPHALAHPLTGWGPGSFVVFYPDWETERLRAGAGEDARRFAAAQRHAHNDYLEMLVTLGPLGLAAWLAVIVAALRGLRGRAATGEDICVAAGAGVCALLAVALVDFPFQRPVETFVFWTLLAVLLRPGARREFFMSRGVRPQ